jgi:hypothetical protein
MKPSIPLHTFLTWVLAQLLHPFVMMILSVLHKSETYLAWSQSLEAVLFIMFWGVVLSIPSFFIAMLGLRVVTSASMSGLSPVLLYALWILVSVSSVCAGGCLISLVILGTIDSFFLGLLIPGSVAAGVAVLLRFRQFFRLLAIARERQLNENGGLLS